MIYLCNCLEIFLCLVYIYAVMGFALENQIMLMEIYANTYMYIYDHIGVKIVLP